MPSRRLAILIVLATLLLLVMAAAQVTLAARSTILGPAFVERHVAALGARMAQDTTHDGLIRSLVDATLGPAGTDGLPHATRERVVRAVAVALSPRWIQGELSRATTAALAVLRGGRGPIRYQVDLASRKEILTLVLATDVPELGAALTSIPDTLPLAAIIGTGLVSAMERGGRLFVPLSILLVFVGPAALVIACQLVGGVRHGLWVAGAATVAAALLLLVGVRLGYGAVDTGVLSPAIRSLPPSLAWAGGELAIMAAEIRDSLHAISASFAAVGGSLGAVGVVLAVWARRAGV